MKNRWAMFPYQFSVNSVVSITFSTFARLQDDKARLKRALEKTLFFVSLTIFPLLTGMVVMAYPLTSLIPKYHQWQPALPYLLFFCLNIAFAAIANPVINTLNAVGRINQTLKLMIVMMVATWMLTPLCLYLFGTIGVSLAAAVVAMISLIAVRLVRSVAWIDLLSCIWRQLIATVVMGAYLWIFQAQWAESWSRFLTGIVSGVLVFAVVFLLVGYRKTLQEVKSLLAVTTA